MMHLAVAASCLFQLLAVALGGGAPAEDTSALLQERADPLSLERTSLEVDYIRSLLVAAQADIAKRTARVQGSGAGAGAGGETVDVSVIQPKLTEATEFITDTVTKWNATLNATRRADTQQCKAWCATTMVLDSIAIIMEAGMLLNKRTDLMCAPAVLVEWWVMGLITLTQEQDMKFPEAVHMLVQQYTSIGYGSSTPKSKGLKMFHGLHGVLSQMSVARVVTEAVEKAFELLGESPLAATAALTLTLAASTLLFATDLHFGNKTRYPSYLDAILDGLYQSLITATTIGYGDLSPTTAVGKVMTPIGLPMLTGAWSNFAGKLLLKQKPDDDTVKPLELCMCFGKNLCR